MKPLNNFQQFVNESTDTLDKMMQLVKLGIIELDQLPPMQGVILYWGGKTAVSPGSTRIRKFVAVQYWREWPGKSPTMSMSMSPKRGKAPREQVMEALPELISSIAKPTPGGTPKPRPEWLVDLDAKTVDRISDLNLPEYNEQD